MKINILCFGFGPSHLVYSEIIKKCNWINKSYCLSQTSTYETENIKVFGEDNYYSLENIDLSDSSASQTTVDATIMDVDKKRFTKHQAKFKELYFEIVKDRIIKIFDEFKPDLILFSKSVEVPEGILLYDLAKKRNILCAIPHSLRFLGGSFFSQSPFEREFDFLKKNDFKGFIDYNISSLPMLYETPLPKPLIIHSLLKRLKRFYKLLSKKPYNFTLMVVKIRLSNSFFKNRKFRKFRSRLIYKSYSIHPDYSQKYIYYPLHVTPETSINIPNPFFIDQLRAIDKIRYNLPPNYMLYIKEHPVGLAKRNTTFYNKLNNLSRVRLIDIDIESKELILNSQCVISVTGTACLEAFFMKKPSFTIGDAFFSNFLKNDFTSLKKEKFHYPTDEEIQFALNAFKSNSSDFVAFTPDYFNVTEHKNILNYIKSLEEFLFDNETLRQGSINIQ